MAVLVKIDLTTIGVSLHRLSWKRHLLDFESELESKPRLGISSYLVGVSRLSSRLSTVHPLEALIVASTVSPVEATSWSTSGRSRGFRNGSVGRVDRGLKDDNLAQTIERH